jgi:hypothetical protein
MPLSAEDSADASWSRATRSRAPWFAGGALGWKNSVQFAAIAFSVGVVRPTAATGLLAGDPGAEADVLATGADEPEQPH